MVKKCTGHQSSSSNQRPPSILTGLGQNTDEYILYYNKNLSVIACLSANQNKRVADSKGFR